MRTMLLPLALLALLPLALCAPSSAQITSLPGLNQKLNFNQYAGYITVDKTAGRNLFYWFVESQNDPATDPLFIWLQGGPGCSSLIGFLTEHGPFIINENQEVTLNPYTWNTNANVIYLDSPAGVGFSYGNNPLSNGDNQTMQDSYNFLQQWFQLFPEFQTNDFYVSGESYGGHYVPQLAWTILNGNKNAATQINLKGLLVGNPWTDRFVDTWSVPPFIFYHHLCSLPTWEVVQELCIDNTSLDTTTPFIDYMPRIITSTEETCQEALNVMFTEVGNNINQYDIYAPCLGGQGLDCEDYSAQMAWLNNATVQAAIHAKMPVFPGWQVCGDVNYTESWSSVLPIYPDLMDNLHVTVYSGDVTFNVPALGTQTWVENFGRAIVSDYQAWEVDGQVAGYYKKFDGITYVTVKGSGHMVSTFTPIQGKALQVAYLNNTF